MIPSNMGLGGSASYMQREWSPDGKQLVVLSHHDEGLLVFWLSRNTGESRAVRSLFYVQPQQLALQNHH